MKGGLFGDMSRKTVAFHQKYHHLSGVYSPYSVTVNRACILSLRGGLDTRSHECLIWRALRDPPLLTRALENLLRDQFSGRSTVKEPPGPFLNRSTGSDAPN